MRSRAKIDRNQSEIVAALRSQGWTVQSLATVGSGCPDLLVGVGGLNILLEVKDGEKPPSKRKLTELEDKWQRTWRGQVATVNSAFEAVGFCLSWREWRGMAR